MKLEKIDDIEIIEPGAGIDVWLRRSPLRTQREHFTAPVGFTLAEIVELACDLHGLDIRRPLHVTISGHAVERSRWQRVRVKRGATVNIIAVPGRNAIRAILGVVVSIAAVFLAPILAAPIISILGVGGGVIATAITGAIGVGISLVGSLVVNALFPVANSAPGNSANLGQSDSTRALYSIAGGQNSAQRYGPIPVIFGKHRISPPYGAREYTEIVGDEQYLHMLFVVGYGSVDVSDIKIGETPISKFEDAQVEVITDSRSQALTHYNQPVYEESLSVLLQNADDWTTRTTAENVSVISADFSLPNGTYRYQKSDGNRVNYTVEVEVQYAPKSSGAWVSAGRVSITSNSQQAIRRTISWNVAPGQYDVRSRKISGDYSGGDTVSEAVYWIAVRGRRSGNPVNFRKKLTLIDLKIKATNSLSGTIDKLNGIGEMRMRAWNGSAWIDDQHSRNPADHFRYVLQGDANDRPVADSMIDLQSLQDWHAYNVANGFTFDYVTTTTKSVYDTLTMIAAAGRAAVSIRDGKWGVVWDVENAPIVQHFTPRNSWGFQSVRAYADLPHAFRVSFVNAKNGYQLDERVVYDDGYSEANATKFEGINFDGVIDPDLIWRHARYHIAQLRLQREVYTLSADFEHLVCTRGDRVRVNHDTVLWGAGSARVKWVSAAPDVITIDDTFTMEAGKTYSMRFRLHDGSSIVRTITGVAGEFQSFALAGSGALPNPGDLVLFGENTLESVVLRVKSVTAQADLTAKIELVDDAPAIMQADKGTIPPFVTGIAGLIDYRSYAPRDLTSQENIWTTSPPTSAVDLSWAAPTVGSVSGYIIQVASAGSGNWGKAISSNVTSAKLSGLSAGNYDVRVRAIFTNGELSDWLTGKVSALLFQKLPADVKNFRIAVSGDATLLQWDEIEDQAVASFQIRFSPEITGVSWETATILRAGITGSNTQVNSARGTYLIKAISYSGLASAHAALIVSTIDGLTSFNAVETITDSTFNGSADRVHAYKSQLRLSAQGDVFKAADWFAPADFFLQDGGLEPEGFYYFDRVIDLTEVYTSRLTASISAYGELATDDVFARPDWFAVSNFFSDVAGLWDVAVEVSATNDDPAGAATWSPWAELVTGDISGRAFKFRLRLTSDRRDVTPVVTAASIKIDMPDRIISGADIIVGPTGLRVNFSPAYKVLQGLSFAAQGLETGDYYEVTNKSETGFDIIFKNSAGAPVTRSLDYVAKGYGSLN